MGDKTPTSDESDVIADLPVESALSLEDSTPFEVLSKRRRRYALFYLMNTSDSVVELEDLADQIEAWERDADEEVPEDHRKRLRAELYHIDLPRLADAGILEFDPRSRMVRYRGDDAYEAALKLLATMDGG